MRKLLLLVALVLRADEDEVPQAGPWIYRLEPFGGARGATAVVEVTGERFGKLEGVWFDRSEEHTSELQSR